MDNTSKYENEPFNVYVNGIQIAANPFDFTFILNNNSPTGNKFIGEIKMSPEHVKVFAHMLLENVKQYEEVFGQIPQLDPQRIQELQANGKIRVEEKIGNE